MFRVQSKLAASADTLFQTRNRGWGMKLDVFQCCLQSRSSLIGGGGGVSDQRAPRMRRATPGPLAWQLPGEVCDN